MFSTEKKKINMYSCTYTETSTIHKLIKVFFSKNMGIYVNLTFKDTHATMHTQDLICDSKERSFAKVKKLVYCASTFLFRVDKI